MRSYNLRIDCNVSDKVDMLQDCTFLASDEWSLTQSDQILIQFTDTRVREKVDDVTFVVVLNAIIQPVSSIQSLGVTLDRKLLFDQHVHGQYL